MDGPDGTGRLPDVPFEQFSSLDLRIGRVESVEAFPEARQPALKLRVDFGPVIGTLQTSAQVTNYSDADLIGRLIVGAINLGPKRVAGFRSDFLLLGALAGEGGVALLRPDRPAQPGDRVA